MWFQDVYYVKNPLVMQLEEERAKQSTPEGKAAYDHILERIDPLVLRHME